MNGILNEKINDNIIGIIRLYLLPIIDKNSIYINDNFEYKILQNFNNCKIRLMKPLKIWNLVNF